MPKNYYPTDTNTLTSNRRLIAAFSRDDLNEKTAEELRKLCRMIGVKHGNVGGEIKQVNALKKVQLVEVLLKETDDIRRLVKGETPDLTDEDIKTLGYEDVFNLLLLAERKETDLDRKTAAMEVAVEVDGMIRMTYPDGDKPRHATRNNKRGDYRVRVEKLVKSDGSLMVAALFSVYSDMLSRLGRKDVAAKVADDKVRKDSYLSGTSSNKINHTLLIDWAEKTLRRVKVLQSSRWTEVALALVIATGRRVYSEVLCQASQFRAVDDKTLGFIGVAKSKGEELDLTEYDIPTLVNSSLVMEGFNWLERNGKRYPVFNRLNRDEVVDAREGADRRYSSDMSRFFRTIRGQFIVGDEDVTKKFTVHSVRALYVLKLTSGLSDYEKRTVGSKLLCHHSDGTVAADSYISQFTVL